MKRVREAACVWVMALSVGCSAADQPPLGAAGANGGGQSLGGTAAGGTSTGGAPNATGGTLQSGGSASQGGGGSTSGGAAGSSGSGGSGGTPVEPLPDWDPAPTSGADVWVRVRNYCPFPLWIHATGSSGTLQPDDQKLETGDSIDYPTAAEWSAARVTAFADGPKQGELEKAEMTISGGSLNYNITYVDWLGLPLEIYGVGGSCKKEQHTTACYAQESDVLNGCPHDFLREGKKCLSARSYCMNAANTGSDYCHALDPAITKCNQDGLGCPPLAPGAGTPEVYACTSGSYYGSNASVCALVNRGMVDDPDNKTPSAFYKSEPYNDYSAWVHQVCPNIYGFPYDDAADQSGFQSCLGNELRITFCPSR